MTPYLPASPGGESRQVEKSASWWWPSDSHSIHLGKHLLAFFLPWQPPRCWNTERIRPLLLTGGRRETQMSKVKASLYSLHPWDSKSRPFQRAAERNGGEPPNEAWGGRENPGRVPCVCVCLPECLPSPCPSSYLLTRASLLPTRPFLPPLPLPQVLSALGLRGTFSRIPSSSQPHQ